jgi:hypothetical protein
VHVDATGAPAGGTVDVRTGGSTGPIARSVPTGTAADVPSGPTHEVWIHYVAGPKGPVEIDVTYSVSET